MSLTPAEIWPMITGSAIVVFGAGALTEKIRNNKYVSKTECEKQHQTEKEWRDSLKQDIRDIKTAVTRVHERLDSSFEKQKEGE